MFWIMETVIVQPLKRLLRDWPLAGVLILALIYSHAGIRADLSKVKAKVAEIKTEVAGVKTEAAEIKTEISAVKKDIDWLKNNQNRLWDLIVPLITQQTHSSKPRFSGQKPRRPAQGGGAAASKGAKPGSKTAAAK